MIDRISAVLGRDVSRETFDQLDAYAALLREGAVQQNLIAASTVDELWDRHMLDSAQLVRFAPSDSSSWADIGSGAGLPGVVIAALVSGQVTLIEPRRLRADFLQSVIEHLDLTDRVSVKHAKAERLKGAFDVITARAVAALPKLLEISAHLSTRNTVWVLPKGRNAATELAEATRAWQGEFRLEPSVTGEDSYIIVGQGVGKKR